MVKAVEWGRQMFAIEMRYSVYNSWRKEINTTVGKSITILQQLQSLLRCWKRKNMYHIALQSLDILCRFAFLLKCGAHHLIIIRLLLLRSYISFFEEVKIRLILTGQTLHIIYSLFKFP